MEFQTFIVMTHVGIETTKWGLSNYPLVILISEIKNHGNVGIGFGHIDGLDHPSEWGNRGN